MSRLASSGTRPVRPRSRRGTAYVLAIGLGVLLATVAMGTAMVGRRLLDTSSDAAATIRAERAATASLAWALRRLDSDSEFAKGEVATTRTQTSSLGGATLRSMVGPYAGVVPPDQLAPAVVAGEGSRGPARRRLEAKAFPSPRLPSGLHAPLSVGGKLTIGSGATIQLLEGAARTTTVQFLGPATINGVLHTVAADPLDAWASAEAAIQRPSFPSDDALEALAAAGTPLVVPGGTLIERWLLSPTANPGGGALDARGLYVFDCNGATVTIRSSRIVGTLVLVDPGIGSRIEGSVHFEPALRGMPSLVVLGSLHIALSATNLSEAETPGRNFNPFGTPYPFGVGAVDEDRTDVYPSRINGSVLVRDSLRVTGNSNLAGGLAVRGDLRIEGTAVFGRDPWIRTCGPNSLAIGRWRLALGSLFERIDP